MDTPATDDNQNELLLKIHSFYKILDPLVAPSLRLADAIKAAVLQGVLKSGEPVPSTRNLAEALAVNPMTATKALKYVADLGVIKHSRGTNYVVCDGAQKRCTGIAENEISCDLRYLHRKMMNYSINRTYIIQVLKGYEAANKSIEEAQKS